MKCFIIIPKIEIALLFLVRFQFHDAINHETLDNKLILQIPPPVVCWNIAPSMGHAYNCREAELVPIPRYSLRPLEKVGSCHAGEVTH